MVYGLCLSVFVSADLLVLIFVYVYLQDLCVCFMSVSSSYVYHTHTNASRLWIAFIFKHENDSVTNQYTMHPAGRPNYILAVEGKSLVVKVSMLLASLPYISNYYDLTEANCYWRF